MPRNLVAEPLERKFQRTNRPGIEMFTEQNVPGMSRPSHIGNETSWNEKSINLTNYVAVLKRQETSRQRPCSSVLMVLNFPLIIFLQEST